MKVEFARMAHTPEISLVLSAETTAERIALKEWKTSLGKESNAHARFTTDCNQDHGVMPHTTNGTGPSCVWLAAGESVAGAPAVDWRDVRMQLVRFLAQHLADPSIVAHVVEEVEEIVNPTGKPVGKAVARSSPST